MNKPRRGNRNLIRAMNRNLILNIIRSQAFEDHIARELALR